MTPLEAFAKRKCLSLEYLSRRHVSNEPSGGIRFDYGDNARARIRKNAAGSHPTWWCNGDMRPMRVLGNHLAERLAVRPNKTLVIVEGESDTLTLWLHNRVAIGVPGSTMAKVIVEDDVSWAERVYIQREPGEAGREFVRHVAKRLRDLLFNGAIFEISLAPHKDASELHIALNGDHEKFSEALDVAIAGASVVNVGEEPLVRECDSPDAYEWGDTAPWPTLNGEALYGIAGEVVRIIEPHSEADPAALLAHILVTAGAFIGPGPHYEQESTPQPARLFALFVGETSHGRKGTARHRVQYAFRIADETTLDALRASGLASGEGLIERLCDKQGKDGETIPAEKRLLVSDSEFSRVLTVAGRDGNSLSMQLRGFWESGYAENMTRKDPVKVRGAHVCLTSDITPDEWAEKMPSLEIANGLLNRFLIVCSRRSKMLPHGGNLSDAALASVAHRLRVAIDEARDRGRMYMTNEASEVWETWYCEPQKVAGLLAAATGRREPYVLRLALTYALLDQADKIDAVHLRAALAFWDYCFASARYLLGSRLGDPVADRLLHKLREVYPEGMDGREMDSILGKSLRPGKLEAVRNDLESRGFICHKPEPPGPQGGRPRVRFYAVPRPDKPDKGGQTHFQVADTEVCPVNPVCPAPQRDASDVVNGAVRASGAALSVEVEEEL